MFDLLLDEFIGNFKNSVVIRIAETGDNYFLGQVYPHKDIVHFNLGCFKHGRFIAETGPSLVLYFDSSKGQNLLGILQSDLIQSDIDFNCLFEINSLEQSIRIVSSKAMPPIYLSSFAYLKYNGNPGEMLRLPSNAEDFILRM